MAVIGIDLGTTNSLAAVWRNGKAELIADALGNLIIPSVVAVDEEGNILVGQAAKEEELIHPERCASSFKRFMGMEKKYRLAEKEFTPEELSALVLKKIKEIAEEYLQEEQLIFAN